MKPLLAHIYEPHRVTYPCFVQPKLNGIRALYQGGHFQSRDELPFPPGLLEHLATPLRQTFDESIILDGELYVHGWPLQRINAAVTPVRQQPTEDTLKVEYHVFDVVDFGKSFHERGPAGHGRKIYEAQLPLVKEVMTYHAHDEEEGNYWYSQFVSDGYEGMMYRLGDCPYTEPKQDWTHARTLGMQIPNLRSRFLSDKNNRCWHLLKRKDWQDDEFECTGIIKGEGKYQETLGAFICRNTKQALETGCRLIEFSVGSGLTDSERDHYWANPPIGRLIKVKYLVLSNDGIPLNPTILAIL